VEVQAVVAETPSCKMLLGAIRSVEQLTYLEQICERARQRKDFWALMILSEGLKSRLEAVVCDLPRNGAQCLDAFGWNGAQFRAVPVVSAVVQALRAHHDAVAAAAQMVTTQDAQTQTEQPMEEVQSEKIPQDTLERRVLSMVAGARDLLASSIGPAGDLRQHRSQLALLLYTVKDDLDKGMAARLGQPWHADCDACGPWMQREFARLRRHISEVVAGWDSDSQYTASLLRPWVRELRYIIEEYMMIAELHEEQTRRDLSEVFNQLEHDVDARNPDRIGDEPSLREHFRRSLTKIILLSIRSAFKAVLGL